MSVMNEEHLGDDPFVVLSNEEMLINGRFLPKDEKLALLSRILSVLDDDFGSGEMKLNKWLADRRGQTCVHSLLKFVKSSLTDDQNMFVIYTARKVVTCLIKLYKSEDGMNLLKDILSSGDSLDCVCTGLQICKELLSRNASSHEWILSHLTTSVLTVWKTLQIEYVHSITYNQCLLQFFCVCVKLAKIVQSTIGQKEAQEVLQEILKSEKLLNSVLFQDPVKVYVKRKLIHLVCFLTKPFSLTNDNPLYEDIVRISASVFEKLCSCDILKILKKPGVTTFVGTCYTRDSNSQDESVCYDIVNVREWTFLCFCVTAVLARQEDNKEKGVTFLVRLDDVVKNLVGKQQDLLFPWLPDVYIDQDDMWIDVMLLLIDIFPGRTECYGSCVREEMWNQHHYHFLQFVGILGYDHLVLVDLLTSPETNFLTYLLKYLKFLLKTWKIFIAVTVKYFKQTEKQASTMEDTVEKADREVNEKMCLTEDTGEQHEKECSKVLALSSLTMIADAYDDDDDDGSNDISRKSIGDYVDTKSNADETGCEEVVVEHCMEICENRNLDSYNDIEDERTRIRDNSQKTYLETGTNIRDNLVIPKENIVRESIKNEEIDKNVPVRKEFNPGINHSANGSEEICDAVCAVVSQDIDLGLYGDCSRDSVLDKVMGMLVRTRLNLEKLSKSDLIRYNPAVLVSLIASVEQMYEEI